MAETVVNEKKEVLKDGTEVTTQTVEETIERAPNPQDNPRNAILSSVAKQAFAQHDAEAKENAKIPITDDEGHIVSEGETEVETPPAEEAATPSEETPAPAAETPPPQGDDVIDPNKEYEVVVEGQKMKVPGKAIIDAGRRTFSKETAADMRLRTASQLLEEAERRLASTQPGETPKQEQPPQGGKSEAELAHMLQFGTPEQSAEAVKLLRAGGASEEKVAQLAAEAARAAVRDELQFDNAKRMLKSEYGDLLSKPTLQGLFFAEERRLRDGGDKRPYHELYKAIGEQIRKDFNLPKPQASQTPGRTATERKAAKAAVPAVPRSAASRAGEEPAAKPKTNAEIIAAMAASRGQNRLTPIRKE